MKNRLHYILFYKPYGVLSQFTHEAGYPSLLDFGPFPRGVYPVGRLDADSEGLLLLTDDNDVKHRLTDPRFGHPKTYLAQVEHVPSDDGLQTLRDGVLVGGKKTLPAHVKLLAEDPGQPQRSVPIRYRKTVPTSWLEITLREGRNRQVRRMTATIGHPTVRLIRTRIADLSIGGLHPGQQRRLTPKEVVRLKESGTASARPR
jgi:23S rRNA pseudouridine2457 synthase